jgi:hypothetical protein
VEFPEVRTRQRASSVSSAACSTLATTRERSDGWLPGADRRFDSCRAHCGLRQFQRPPRLPAGWGLPQSSSSAIRVCPRPIPPNPRRLLRGVIAFKQVFAETQTRVRRREVLAEERDARVPHRLVQRYRRCETRSRFQHDPRHAEQPRLALESLDERAADASAAHGRVHVPPSAPRSVPQSAGLRRARRACCGVCQPSTYPRNASPL